jgi:hypothetical protein
MIRVWFGYRDAGGVARYPTTPEFTGRIMNVPETEAGATVDLSCVDMGTDPKRQNRSTAIQNGGAISDGVQTHYWIASLAGLASLSMAASSETGLMMIPFVGLDDDELMGEIGACASSEGGVAFIDGSGNLAYWSATHWIGASSVATITVADYAELQPKRNGDNEWNIIPVEYQPRQRGKPAKVYSMQRGFCIPPQIGASPGSHTATLNFSLPLVSFISYTMQVCSGGGVDMSTAVTLSSDYPTASKRWPLTWRNSDPNQAAYVTKFEVLGYPLEGRTSESYTTVNTTGNPDRRMPPLRNDYIQTEEQARYLADMLADRLGTVRLQLTAQGLAANPLLELGDVVTVTSVLTGISTNAIVVGKKSHYVVSETDGSLTMDLDLVDVTGMYGSNNYFRVGTSALGSSGGEAWY